MTPMPDYQAGQTVNLRPEWLARQRDAARWEGVQGIIESVDSRYLPAITVLWLSGPLEGQTRTVPFYQIVPEGQEELLTMELEDEDDEDI